MSTNPEKGKLSASSSQGTEMRVFQPPKLTEVMEMLEVIGTYTEKIREDSSHDLGGATAQTSQQAGAASGQSARDLAIASLPSLPVMQQKLVSHIQSEMKSLQRQARSLSHLSQKGSAYLLNEVYKKIRRFSSLIDEILQASAEVIRRLYIAVFIDHRPLLAADAIGRSA